MPCTLFLAFDTVEDKREAFLLQNVRMKQKMRDIFVTMRTHDIFVEVSVWPCKDGTMRAPVPLKADNPAFPMRLVANDEE